MSKKVFPILFATLLIDMIGIGMIVPIIPIIFTDPSSSSFILPGYSAGQQYVVAGLVTALFGLMQFLAAPVLGDLSDFFGRKKFLTLGVAVLAVSQFLFGLGIEIGSLGLIFFSRAVAGLSAANFSIAQAAIADVSAPKDRAKNFGLIGAAFGLGFIIGPLLGGWVAGLTGNAAAPFWGAALLGVVNVAFISLFLPETRAKIVSTRSFNLWKGIRNIQAAWSDKEARTLYLASFLYVSGFAFFMSFVGIMLVARFGLSEGAVGTFFGVSGIWIVITQLIILRWLSRKYNERTILRWSLLVLAVAIVAYPFMPSLMALYLVVPVLAIPQGLSTANMGALISHSVSSDKQGAALGINGSLMALSNGVIPLVAGFGSGFFGLTAPFIAGAVMVVVAWGVLFARRAH